MKNYARHPQEQNRGHSAMANQIDREGFIGRLRRANEVNITVTGRRTKKRISTPVWFVLEGKTVLLVPTKGSDNDWFRNLAKEPIIGLTVNEVTFQSVATPVRDSRKVEEILDKFRAKYKTMWSESYYAKRDAYVEVPL